MYKVLFGAKKVVLLIVLITVVSKKILAQEQPKKQIAYKTVDAILIDGLDNETSWQNTKWSSSFVDISNDNMPAYDTRYKVLWDKKYLYFFVKMEEPHVWGNITEHDAVIFHNNDFEVFMDPDGDTHNYYEFQINALKTVWDLMLSAPYRNGTKVMSEWNIEGLKTGVQVYGTLNNPLDIDKEWTVEIAMPWKAFKSKNASKIIPKNNFWRINFSRVQWEHSLEQNVYQRKKDSITGKLLNEDNWVWSPQGAVNMHMPEKWGYIYFSSKTVHEVEEWEIPKDEYIKWKLYDLYNQIRKKRKLNKQNEFQLDTINVHGKTMQPYFEAHNNGWKVWVKSPFTNKILTIKNDSKFTYETAKK